MKNARQQGPRPGIDNMYACQENHRHNFRPWSQRVTLLNINHCSAADQLACPHVLLMNISVNLLNKIRNLRVRRMALLLGGKGKGWGVLLFKMFSST